MRDGRSEDAQMEERSPRGSGHALRRKRSGQAFAALRMTNGVDTPQGKGQRQVE
jgi:hypothetical protein